MITEEYLRQEHHENNMSIRDIAKKLNKPYSTINLIFKKYNIKPIKTRKIKGSRFKELNNKKWLHYKYEVELLSTLQISKILGCNSNTVRMSLIRNNFKIRNARESQVDGSGDKLALDMEIINGLMLGDACMRRGKTSVSMPYLTHVSKHKEYSNHLSKTLFSDLSRVFVHSNNAFSVRSLSSNRLNDVYNKWYRDNVKIIPSDLIVTPKTLLYWFMDDGSSYQRRNESKTKQVYVTLCSESFSLFENEFLIKQINKLGIYPTLKNVKWGSGYRILIKQSEYQKFINTIEKSPVKCFEYKWK